MGSINIIKRDMGNAKNMKSEMEIYANLVSSEPPQHAHATDWG